MRVHNSACYCPHNYPQMCSILSQTCACKLRGTIAMVGREVFCLNRQIEWPVYLCKLMTFDILDITAF